MSKEPEMTAAEEVATREWANDDAMPPVNTSWKADVRRCLASLDASRAREAKLVEALRDLQQAVGEIADEAASTWIAERLRALLPTPAEMPSDVHPQEG